MKITQKILSIPPFISTSWKNVTSLHLEERNLVSFLIIGLLNGATIEIPNLDKSMLQAIFAAHEKYLEQETQNQVKPQTPIIPDGNAATVVSLPLNLGIEPHMGSLLQHNPEAMDSPDLPKDLLEKIATLSKVVGFDNIENFPNPEPHCNCMHCQIIRVIQDGLDDKGKDEEDEEELEEVTIDDLRFREWDIKQTAEKLYTVGNPLNTEEHYTVFLGSPVGCTCGQANCEHIRAVLNS